MPSKRNVPGWVITDRYVDEELGVIKAGKEAGVFLVRRRSGDRWCLLASKHYRKRTDRQYKSEVRPGERSFRRNTYQDWNAIRNERDRRAAIKKTSWGRGVIEGVWAGNEFGMLRRVWEGGANVPYPVQATEDGFLMQFVGTTRGAAPRLSDLRLDTDEAARMFDLVLDNVGVFVRENVVHADLSAYNVLVQNGKPWIIDFPQAVSFFGHNAGPDLLRRDVANLCRHFARLGVDRDPDDVVADLLEANIPGWTRERVGRKGTPAPMAWR
jgi:RIO kinase 1